MAITSWILKHSMPLIKCAVSTRKNGKGRFQHSSLLSRVSESQVVARHDLLAGQLGSPVLSTMENTWYYNQQLVRPARSPKLSQDAGQW